MGIGSHFKEVKKMAESREVVDIDATEFFKGTGIQIQEVRRENRDSIVKNGVISENLIKKAEDENGK